ncbi:MAG: hypothetical protein HY691_17025 [Chloroflexi bacterium]|nr:hypothetical protein [Chloroflexota bacterium]
MARSEGSGQPAVPWWRLWGAFFAYAALAALAVQLVLLPRVFPTWHAGDGLLVEGDWLTFHRMAAELAGRIRAEGWAVWELRPAGQAPVGIAAAIYALTVPQPWALVPLNAALHATAALVLLRIVLGFVADWRVAAAAALPFLVLPSALTWYAQIHKDGFSIAGVLLALHGWLLLAQPLGPRRPWRPLVAAALLIGLGTALVWLVRPYLASVLHLLGFAAAAAVSVAALLRARRAGGWLRAAAVAVVAWGVVVALALPGMPPGEPLAATESSPPVGSSSTAEPATRAGSASSLPPEPSGAGARAAGLAGTLRCAVTTEAGQVVEVVWQRSWWLPAGVDQRLCGVTAARWAWYVLYPDARTLVDPEVRWASAGDLVVYLPRAVQIGLLAPFPAQWLEAGRTPTTTALRRVTAVEMLIVYIALAGLPLALWRWRRRLDLWLGIAFCGMLLVFHVLVAPNVGALHRLRYAYLMTLVALGLAGGLATWLAARRPTRDTRAGGRHTSPAQPELLREGSD